MGGERARRLGLNEALFREVNERLRDVGSNFDAGTTDFVCECASAACAERVELSLGEYERVRADPTHFIVRPGHIVPDIESVVSESDGYTVICKHVGEPAQLAKTLDPRS